MEKTVFLQRSFFKDCWRISRSTSRVPSSPFLYSNETSPLIESIDSKISKMSKELVPFVFPILKLPNLALLSIMDLWCPTEIFHFSLVSKKTKCLARLANVTVHLILLRDKDSFPTICLREDDQYINEKIIWLPYGHQIKYVCYPEVTTIRGSPKYFSENLTIEVFKILEHLMSVFKYSMLVLNFSSGRFSSLDLYAFADWCIAESINIGVLGFNMEDEDDINFFLEDLKLTAKTIDIALNCELVLKETYNIPSSVTPFRCQETSIIKLTDLTCSILSVMNSPIIYNMFCMASNQALNIFLKNWRNGLTNSELKIFHLTKEDDEDGITLREVLDGIETYFLDPRIVKRDFEFENSSFRIFGGLHIDGPNGTTAAIQWFNYSTQEMDSEVPLDWIADYEKFEINNNKEILDEPIWKFSMAVF